MASKVAAVQRPQHHGAVGDEMGRERRAVAYAQDPGARARAHHHVRRVVPAAKAVGILERQAARERAAGSVQNAQRAVLFVACSRSRNPCAVGRKNPLDEILGERGAKPGGVEIPNLAAKIEQLAVRAEACLARARA